MNSEEEKYFVDYYIENVLKDLQPMMYDIINSRVEIYLDCGLKESSPKYNMEEAFKIFEKHINISEYNKFCNLLNIDWFCIYRWIIKDYPDKYFYYKLKNREIDTKKIWTRIIMFK